MKWLMLCVALLMGCTDAPASSSSVAAALAKAPDGAEAGKLECLTDNCQRSRRENMDDVSAEVTYRQGAATATARALQQLGFRIFDVGDTISVQAPRQLWESVFGLEFETRSKQVTDTTETTYLRPAARSLDIPDNLDDLVTDVLFVEPPRYFAS